MASSLERIEQELAAMDGAIASLATQLHSAYSDYLTQLGQAVSQQLILASYHVCTQGYPEQFLNLSYPQRYELQQTLRRLAEQIQEELLAQIHPPIVPVDPEIASLPDRSSEEQTPNAISVTENLISKAKKPQLTPIHLAEWQQDLELAIVQELRTASHAANRVLQQANILPSKLPNPVLEAAAKVNGSEGSGQVPNLMNLLVETAQNDLTAKGNSDSLKEQTVMHIVAIHLRLSDIEFSSATVNSARTRIRSLLAQLKTLGRDYQKKQRDRAIAQAQEAWRASWTES